MNTTKNQAVDKLANRESSEVSNFKAYLQEKKELALSLLGAPEGKDFYKMLLSSGNEAFLKKAHDELGEILALELCEEIENEVTKDTKKTEAELPTLNKKVPTSTELSEELDKVEEDANLSKDSEFDETIKDEDSQVEVAAREVRDENETEKTEVANTIQSPEPSVINKIKKNALQVIKYCSENENNPGQKIKFEQKNGISFALAFMLAKNEISRREGVGKKKTVQSTVGGTPNIHLSEGEETTNSQPEPKKTTKPRFVEIDDFEEPVETPEEVLEEASIEYENQLDDIRLELFKKAEAALVNEAKWDSIEKKNGYPEGLIRETMELYKKTINKRDKINDSYGEDKETFIAERIDPIIDRLTNGTDFGIYKLEMQLGMKKEDIQNILNELVINSIKGKATSNKSDATISATSKIDNNEQLEEKLKYNYSLSYSSEEASLIRNGEVLIKKPLSQLNGATEELIMDYLINESRIDNFGKLKKDTTFKKRGYTFDNERFHMSTDSTSMQVGVVLKRQKNTKIRSLSGEISDGHIIIKLLGNAKNLKELLKGRKKTLESKIQASIANNLKEAPEVEVETETKKEKGRFMKMIGRWKRKRKKAVLKNKIRKQAKKDRKQGKKDFTV